MALFSKVVGCTASDGFTQGAPPKGVLLEPGGSMTVKDNYGNSFVLSVPTSANGGYTKIFPIQVKEVTTAPAGATAYMLW